jgi:hypothetical protein
VKPLAELFRVDLAISAPLARDDDATGCHARKPREADEFPGHPHRRVAYDEWTKRP